MGPERAKHEQILSCARVLSGPPRSVIVSLNRVRTEMQRPCDTRRSNVRTTSRPYRPLTTRATVSSGRIPAKSCPRPESPTHIAAPRSDIRHMRALLFLSALPLGMLLYVFDIYGAAVLGR